MPSNDIEPTEPLARYIYSKRHFKGNKVKHGAFWPSRLGEVSVFRIKEWSGSEIWGNGLDVGKCRDASLKGRGDFNWGSLKEITVKIFPDSSPSKHANIKNFPEDREKKQEQAEILARASMFIKYSPAI